MLMTYSTLRAYGAVDGLLPDDFYYLNDGSILHPAGVMYDFVHQSDPDLKYSKLFIPTDFAFFLNLTLHVIVHYSIPLPEP